MPSRLNRAFTPPPVKPRSLERGWRAVLRSFSQKPRALARGAGFTLVEVLVAVAILSTAIIFILRSFQTSIATAQFSQDVSLGCYLAEAKSWEIIQAAKLGTALIAPSEGEKLQGRSFQWNYKITPDTSADLTDLKQLELGITLPTKHRKDKYILSFFSDIYLPAQKTE